VIVRKEKVMPIVFLASGKKEIFHLNHQACFFSFNIALQESRFMEKVSRFQPGNQTCFFSFNAAPQEASFVEKVSNFQLRHQA
jgi:hypothetical protein